MNKRETTFLNNLKHLQGQQWFFDMLYERFECTNTDQLFQIVFDFPECKDES